jgi:hypothetical protein
MDAKDFYIERETGLFVDGQEQIVLSRAAIIGFSSYEGIGDRALISNALI